MSTRESSPSPEYDEFDDQVDTAVHERIPDSPAMHDEPEYDDEPREIRERGPRRTDAARAKMMARRRQTLMALAAVQLLTLAVSVFAGSWTWVLTAAAFVALVAYLAHLRSEARREEERRLTREVRANRAPRDVLERPAVATQSSLAANAFVVGSISEPEAVMLDDEDPEFYEIADAPVADSVDLSGHRYYSEYVDSPDYYDWDYDSEDYGINGGSSGVDEEYDHRHAV